MTAALDEQLLAPFTASSCAGGQSAVRRIEVRVSIPDKFLLRVLNAWLEGLGNHLRYRDERNREGGLASQVGLIFHLIKNGKDDLAAERAFESAGRLGRVLRDYPEIRRFVVGLDAAGDERSSAPRVFLRALNYLKCVQAHNRGPHDAPLIRLGWTFHVGEDFDDLLTALRHIDEVASLLFGDQAGRLGHALALGEDPRRFYARRNGASEPDIGSHLLDLVWAWGRLADAHETQHNLWIENRVRDLGFRSRVGTPRIADCYRAMSLDRRDGEAHPEKALLDILGFTANSPVDCVQGGFEMACAC